MRRVIVAIGGGKIETRSTAAIDREIIRLSGKKHPNLLFIPTASSDDEEYWERVQKHFGGFLKCRTDVLFLIKERPPLIRIRRKILSADVIYVGGGNTLKMMRLWRRLGVDRILKLAYRQGIVLSGISAGAICWFDSGHSDSMAYYNPRKWKYINVRGLGLIKGIHCPHYNSGTKGIPRRKNFQKMIRKLGGIGIAVEDNCAIEFLDGKFYRVIPSKPRAGAYEVYRNGDKVVSNKVEQGTQVRPFHKLFVTNPCTNPSPQGERSLG